MHARYHRGKTELSDGTELAIGDYSSLEPDVFLRESSALSRLATCSSDFGNEVFFHWIIPLHFFRKQLQKMAVDTVDIRSFDLQGFTVMQAVNGTLATAPRLSMAIYWLYGKLLLFAGPFIFILGYIYSCRWFFTKPDRSAISRALDARRVFLVRSSAGAERISRFANSSRSVVIRDPIFRNETCAPDSLDALLFWHERPALFLLYSRSCFAEFWRLWWAREVIGLPFLRGSIIFYCSLRLAHKVYYEEALRMVLSKASRVTKIYTANKEDRFAVCETRVCRRIGLRLTCFPHGLEYAFPRPCGLAGDIFFCTSKNARHLLEEFGQPEIKFRYSERIVRASFSDEGASAPDKKYVFFTESRNVHVNKEIVAALLSLNVDFAVKLHPADSTSNYSEFVGRINFITGAVQYKDCICLARKSTVLLESVLNQGSAVAILFDAADRWAFYSWFPSLWREDIRRVENLCELQKIIGALQSR